VIVLSIEKKEVGLAAFRLIPLFIIHYSLFIIHYKKMLLIWIAWLIKNSYVNFLFGIWR